MSKHIAMGNRSPRSRTGDIWNDVNSQKGGTKDESKEQAKLETKWQ